MISLIWDVCLASFPNNFCVNAKILMNQKISHVYNVAKGDFNLIIPKLIA